MKSKVPVDLLSHALDFGMGFLSSTPRLLRPRVGTVAARGGTEVGSQRKKHHIDAFADCTPAQRRKIQSLLDFKPQSSLFSKARFPRISRNRWVESSVEVFPSIHTVGHRLQAIDDDKALNLKLQLQKDDFVSKIKVLRTLMAGKLKLEVRQLDDFGTPRIALKTLDGKTLSQPTGSTLLQHGVRGGAMELRRALELATSIRALHKQCVCLSQSVLKAHHDLAVVVGKHRRRGSTELIMTDKIFNQIKDLRVLPVVDIDAGPFCLTPFLQLECFRLHAVLMARAIAGHLTLINRLYNRRNNLKRRSFGTTRPAAFGLATNRMTYFSLPMLEWRLSMRLQDGRYIMRDVVQRTSYSRVRGRMLGERSEPVAKLDGSLSMPAVAYASLLHMGDEYHAVEAARFAYTRVVSSVIESAKNFMSVRSNRAASRSDFSLSTHLFTPNQLRIPIPIFVS